MRPIERLSLWADPIGRHLLVAFSAFVLAASLASVQPRRTEAAARDVPQRLALPSAAALIAESPGRDLVAARERPGLRFIHRRRFSPESLPAAACAGSGASLTPPRLSLRLSADARPGARAGASVTGAPRAPPAAIRHASESVPR